MKTQLPNNCYCSKMAVHPTNWNQVTASTKKDWYIHYRFYDPSFVDDVGKIKPKQISFRGMNDCKNIAERRAVTKSLIANELNRLQSGFNPITGRCDIIPETNFEIDPCTPFIKALKMASDKIKCEPATKLDITSVLKYFKKSAIALRYDHIPISEIRKKHIRLTLDNCQNIKKIWTANQFNHYRKYLSVLFTELCELDAVEFNPVRDIAKKQSVKTLRRTLTPDERKKINEKLKITHYPFWRFIQIFFHSGSRTTELLQVKFEDVDLMNQQYKVTIKKGRQQHEAYKTIKDIALPLWSEIMQSCGPGQYIFGKGLKPNKIPTTNHQITRRWYVHVKDKLGIQADFYSLKHLNTTETIDILNDEDAAKMNGHTSTAMVIGIYDVNRANRQHERLKKVSNSFV